MLRLWRDSCVFKGCVIVAAFFFLVVVAPWIYLDWRTQRDLKAELDRIREAGEPLTLAEAVHDAPPTLKNAAHYYQQALGQVTLTSGRVTTGPSLFEASGYADLITSDYLYGQVSHQTARPAFSDPQVVRAFELLRQGAEQERCVYPLNWHDSMAVMSPHYSDMRSAARCLSAKSKLLTHDGKFDEALDWSMVSLQIGEHTADDPMLIAQLVGVAIHEIGCRRAEETLNEGAPSPEAARELMEEIRAIDIREPFRRSLLGERAMGLEWFQMIRREGMRGFIDAQSMPGVWAWLGAFYASPLGRPLFNNDRVVYLRMMRKQIELIEDAPPEERRQWAAEIEENVPEIAMLSRILIPVFARAASKRDVGIARADLFEIALAAEIYRAERGEWPESLSALQATLSHDLPEDPFAQAPYHYRREQQGYLLWSVGTDLDDDGGHGPRDPGYSHDNCDIVWRVARGTASGRGRPDSGSDVGGDAR